MVGDLERMFVRGYAESSSFLPVLEKLSPCAACSRGCRCSGLADPPAGAPEPGWPRGNPRCLPQRSFSALCPRCDTSLVSLRSSNRTSEAQCLLLLCSTRKEMQEGPRCSTGDFDAEEKAFGCETNSSEMCRFRRSCGRAYWICGTVFVTLPRWWLKAFLRQSILLRGSPRAVRIADWLSRKVVSRWCFGWIFFPPCALIISS